MAAALLVCGAQGLLLSTGPAMADSIRPAYLEIIETSPGSVNVVWKIPRIQGLPSSLWPALPTSYGSSSAVQQFDSSDAVVYKWTMLGGKLAGQTVRIQDLDTFTMDALLRIELQDGTTYRTVLRPASPAFELPAGDESRSAFPVSDWFYPILFLMAFVMSLVLPVKRYGMAYCAVALVAGSLVGRMVGGSLPKQGPPLTHEEAKRVVQGLMLNTYRAFMCTEDEMVYDVLARSVSGDTLNEIYLQNRNRLSFNDPETAASIVDRLDIKSIDSLKIERDGTITMLTDWDVYGSVFHWEHVHFRCNAFKANISIVPSGGYWKIAALEILEEERVL